MASNAKKSAAPAAALTDPVEGVIDLTTSINQIAANNRNANSYEIRNAMVIEENKQRVRYENGVTVLPMSAQQLLANAQRSGYNHRRTLSNNIVADSGAARPINACAHHVVALKDEQAEPSRKKLFDWGIAINDADNGVFLPRWAGKALPGLPNAPRPQTSIPRSTIRPSTRGFARYRNRSRRQGARDCVGSSPSCRPAHFLGEVRSDGDLGIKVRFGE